MSHCPFLLHIRALCRYANYIGEFVHNCVVETGGSPNKNMGGAILCVWKGENGASRGFESFQKAITEVDNDPKVRQLCARYNGAPQFSCVVWQHAYLACGLDRQTNCVRWWAPQSWWALPCTSGRRPALRLGDRRRCGFRPQNRCDIFVTQCQYGSSNGNRNISVRGSPHYVG